jgi:hypothetical protein
MSYRQFDREIRKYKVFETAILSCKHANHLEPIRRPVVLGDGMLLGSNRHDGGSNSLQEDKDVRGEVVVGVLEHQVTRQRTHVTNAGIGNL